MFLTGVVLSKVKGKYIMVLLESTCSGHKRIGFREKGGDKLEVIRLDPYVQVETLYTELKKVKTVRSKMVVKDSYGIPKFDDNGEILDNYYTKKRKIPTVVDACESENM